MRICPNCGEENPERFRLCGFCGAALAPELPPQEVRKTVTIVFSDLKGSTAMGEKLDSEAVREVMSRYFDEMRGALEQHGGMVEKYIGDAIMAVFGLPRVREDDAVRAVRAALEMRQRLAALNEELESRWGVTVGNRTGVNTGEVVAGDPTTGQRLVTGDTVNTAARLEQAAPTNEVLLGEATYRPVRYAVEVEPVDRVEQPVAMLCDDDLLRRGDGHWTVTRDLADVAVPPTINALLAARLDLLNAEERAVIEPASVIGVGFARAAVEALVPEAIGGQVTQHLDALVRKRLISPDEGNDSDPWFRFHHILVRDAAYQGLLKRTRATLHERYADWADEVNRDRERAVEYEEIQGYHLEQAYGYLAELGPLDEHGRELGLRAAVRLSSAGRRAFGRGDMPAAANLLRRSTDLFPEDDRRRLEQLPSLGEAMMEIGEFAWGELFLDESVKRAEERQEVRLLADAVLTRLVASHYVVDDLEGWSAEVIRELERLIPELERLEAQAEHAKAWRLLNFVHGSVFRWSEQVDAVRRAIHHARLAGDARLEARLTAEYANGLRDGPTPAREARRLRRGP